MGDLHAARAHVLAGLQRKRGWPRPVSGTHSSARAQVRAILEGHRGQIRTAPTNERTEVLADRLTQRSSIQFKRVASSVGVEASESSLPELSEAMFRSIELLVIPEAKLEDRFRYELGMEGFTRHLVVSEMEAFRTADEVFAHSTALANRPEPEVQAAIARAVSEQGPYPVGSLENVYAAWAKIRQERRFDSDGRLLYEAKGLLSHDRYAPDAPTVVSKRFDGLEVTGLDGLYPNDDLRSVVDRYGVRVFLRADLPNPGFDYEVNAIFLPIAAYEKRRRSKEDPISTSVTHEVVHAIQFWTRAAYLAEKRR